MNTSDDNRIYIELFPDTRMFFIENIAPLAAGVLLMVLAGHDDDYISLLAVAGVLLLSMLLLYRFCFLARLRWTVTGVQLKSESGVFTRDVQYIELYRVVDYSEKQSFLQMVFGLKDIIIYSGDRTTPALRIIGIPAHVEVIVPLKQLVEQQKKIHQVYEITNR